MSGKRMGQYCFNHSFKTDHEFPSYLAGSFACFQCFNSRVGQQEVHPVCIKVSASVWLESIWHCHLHHLLPQQNPGGLTILVRGYQCCPGILADKWRLVVVTDISTPLMPPVFKLHPVPQLLRVMTPKKGVHNRHHSQKRLLICQETPTGRLTR